MLRFLHVGSIFLLLCLPTFGQLEETGQWSKEVDGVKGRLIAAYDQEFNGTRMVALYLELRSDRRWDLYFDPEKSIESSVIDSQNRPIAKYEAPASIMVSPPTWFVLPFDSTLRFRISVSGYGVPRNAGTNLQMLDGNWLVKNGGNDQYVVNVKLISKPKHENDRPYWKGAIDMPGVLIP